MTETSIRIIAPAKINLYLHIVGRHANGQHLLDSLIAFADIHDTLYLTTSPELSLEIDGPFAYQLTSEPNNLVLQAARKLARLCDVTKGAQLQLTKNLPVASGIGGGSSDAAAVLKGLIQLWKVQPSNQDLQDLALGLGADVPACLNGQTAFISGVGEIISEPKPLPLCFIVLVNSGTLISTQSVFKIQMKLQSSFSKPGRFDFSPENLHEFVSILKTCHNDLDQAAQVLCPEIGQVLSELRNSAGSLLTRMSGSGATCFALFSDHEEATEASLDLKLRHPNWWIKAGSLNSGSSCISK